MKTGFHPMKVRLKLFFEWGISFREKYELPEKGNREVKYASRQELIDKIVKKYHPEWLIYEKEMQTMDETAQKVLESLDESQKAEGDREKMKGNEKSKAKDKPGGKKGGVALKTIRSTSEERSSNNHAAQERDKEFNYEEVPEDPVKAEVKTDG